MNHAALLAPPLPNAAAIPMIHLPRLAAALAAAPVILAFDAFFIGIVSMDSPGPSLVVVRRGVHAISGKPLVFRDPHSGVAVMGSVAQGVPQHDGQVLIEELLDDYGPLPSALVEGAPLLSLDATHGVTLFR